MSLGKQIKDLLNRPENQLNNRERLKRAERLSEKFKHVEPETYVIPTERFYGLPVPQDRIKRDTK